MQTIGSRVKLGLAVSTAMAASLLAAQAGAQVQPSQDTAVSTDPSEPTFGEEVVVTANKREQSLQDVGLAVTAISGNALSEQRVSSLADLARAVPSLTFAPTQYSTPVYTLRGVGFYESSLSSYPTVSIYLDEAPQPIPSMTTHTAFDLERVEVLKGPQGTLFGNNSTGGAINFIAAKPTDTPQAGGDLSFGRFARVEGNAYVSGPITDTLKARVAVNGAMMDDWQRSISRPRETNGEVGYIAGRLLLDWEPGGALRLQLNVNGWRDTSDPQAPQFVGLLPQFPDTVAPLLRTFPLAPRDARVADWQPTSKPSSIEKMGQAALRTDLDVTDDVTLTSITSYAGYNRAATYEFDGTPIANGDYSFVTGRIRTFSQELRLANSGSSAFRWVIGGNYEHTNVGEATRIDLTGISAAPVFGFTGDRVRTEQRLRNYAGFANAEYDLGDLFTVKGGVRYTKADRAFRNCTFDNGDGSFAGVFTGLANAIQFGFVPIPGFAPTNRPVAPLGVNDCAALDSVTFDGTPATFLPGELVAELNQDNVSWRGGIDFKPNDDILLYGNVARGYKSGSFPFLSGATFAQNVSVTQESLLSYEAGFKVQALDRRVTLNGALFLYKYDDKQLRAKVPDPVFGLLEALVNVPKSELKGVEIEASVRPVAGLSVGLAGSYIDSEIKEFTNFSFSNRLTDFAGSPVPYTPKWQLNSVADYKWQIGRVKPFVGATYSWRSSQFANVGGSRGLSFPANSRSAYALEDVFRIESYGLLDLRAGIEAEDGLWRVSVFGKNVTDKYYSTNVQTAYDTVVRFAGMPVTYGVTLAVRYR